jgi:hypothetical protein
LHTGPIAIPWQQVLAGIPEKYERLASFWFSFSLDRHQYTTITNILLIVGFEFWIALDNMVLDFTILW